MPSTSVPSAWIRKAVFKRDKYKCRYCGVPTTIRNKSFPTHRTVDHLIPRSWGGRANFINLVTACQRCNTKKGNLPVKAAGMTLRPTPKHTPEEAQEMFKRVYLNRCVNCGRASRSSHHKAEFHGGPRRCRTGDSYYLARHHLEVLVASGRVPLDRFVPQGYTADPGKGIS